MTVILPGGSAIMAVEVLKSRGVAEERILFVNLIASPEGVAKFAKRFPKLRVVTAFVDQGLDEKKLVASTFLYLQEMLTLVQLYHARPWRFRRSFLHTVNDRQCAPLSPPFLGEQFLEANKNSRMPSSFSFECPPGSQAPDPLDYPSMPDTWRCTLVRFVV